MRRLLQITIALAATIPAVLLSCGQPERCASEWTITPQSFKVRCTCKTIVDYCNGPMWTQTFYDSFRAVDFCDASRQVKQKYLDGEPANLGGHVATMIINCTCEDKPPPDAGFITMPDGGSPFLPDSGLSPQDDQPKFQAQDQYDAGIFPACPGVDAGPAACMPAGTISSCLNCMVAKCCGAYNACFYNAAESQICLEVVDCWLNGSPCPSLATWGPLTSGMWNCMNLGCKGPANCGAGPVQQP